MFLSFRDAIGGQPIGTWQRVAVDTAGRRRADHAVVDADAAIVAGTVVVLDHAGPAASRWSPERAVGPHACLDPVSERRARALDDDGWRDIVVAFARAAAIVRDAGATVVVAVDDDGLLHTTLSPLAGPPQPQRVLEVLRACAPCDLLVVIEDLAPRGLDVTAGLAFANDAVVAAQAKRLIATGGTAWLGPLRDREKGKSADHEGFDLATAAWAVGRVTVDEVWSIVRTRADDARVAARARRLGLHGVLRDHRDTIEAPTTTPETSTAAAPDPFESR